MFTYYVGSDLPDLAITWRDANNQVIDFSSGHTFGLKISVGRTGGVAVVTKTTGFTGSATAPNLVVAWATTGDLNGLTAGPHLLQVVATRTSDGKQRFMQKPFLVKAAVT